MSENGGSDFGFEDVFGILSSCVVIGYFFEGTARVIAVCIGGFVLITSTTLIGAKIAGADDASFGMAVLANIATVVTTVISFSLMTSTSLQALEPVVGLMLEAFVVQGCFSISFGKAIVAVIMSWIILTILLVGLWVAFGKDWLPELLPLLLKLAAVSSLK